MQGLKKWEAKNISKTFLLAAFKWAQNKRDWTIYFFKQAITRETAHNSFLGLSRNNRLFILKAHNLLANCLIIIITQNIENKNKRNLNGNLSPG